MFLLNEVEQEQEVAGNGNTQSKVEIPQSLYYMYSAIEPSTDFVWS